MAAVAALLTAGCGIEPAREGAGDRPNLVLIVVDTLRPDVLGCYGDPRSLSPNIDRLATDGVLFENAVCTSPITAPSHASLFTSRYPSELGVVGNAATDELPGREPVLAELLQRAGYHTGAAVAIAPVRAQWGFDRGFDIFREDGLHNTWILPADDALPQALEVLDSLRQPFFLWSHLADPHEPYNAHGLVRRDAEVMADGRILARVPTADSEVQLIDLELRRGKTEVVIRADHPFKIRRLSLRRRGWIKPQMEPDKAPNEHLTEHRVTISSWRSRTVKLVIQLSDKVEETDQVVQRYGREVAHADAHVGRLVARLKERALYDNTLIVFVSDHGEGLGRHGRRGHARTLYDCMVRVPLIIKPALGANAAFSEGSRRSDPAGLVDLLPTLAAMLDLEDNGVRRGRDLLAGQQGYDDAVLFLETHPPNATRTLYGLRGKRYSVILDADSQTWELFDLTEDPDQLHSLFDPEDPLSQEWQRRLLQHLAQDVDANGRTGDEAPLDSETEEMLRGLGYL